MSRKTRKLIWSAPLVAVLAVASTLAMFVMLAPGGVLAHEPEAGIAPHLPPDAVTRIDVTTPTVANGGRTSLRVAWNAPAAGDPVTKYRVDISTDTLIWNNVIGGEEPGKGTLTESAATNDCGTGDDRNRCYTVTDLNPDTLYHFRVFAINDFGTGAISDDKTIGSGRTLRLDPPGRALGLDATDYHADKIVLTWDEQEETGGGTVKWYCIAVANYPSGAFPALAITTTAANADVCLNASKATEIPEADADGGFTSPVSVDETGNVGALATDNVIVVEASATTYEHLGLGTPPVITLRYRLYAVTEGHDKSRRISRAASQTATGNTVTPRGEPDEREVTPGLPRNLRAVAFSSDVATNADGNEATPVVLPDPGNNQGLYFYWTHPEGYRVPGADADADWRIEVQRRVPVVATDDYPGWVVVPENDAPTMPTAGYANPQFAVDFMNPDTRPTLWGDSASHPDYRVRFVNPAGPEGGWAHITLPEKLDRGYYLDTIELGPDLQTAATSTVPVILKATENGMHTDLAVIEGLRFTRNVDDPIRRIDLRWQRNASSNDEQVFPNGYLIDRSANEGKTWETLFRATTANDLGTARTYIDSKAVVPGKKYTYRVFPVYIQSGPDTIGLPAEIIASSQAADLPSHVRNLDVEANGQTGFDLNWDPPSMDGGHKVMGYVVQQTTEGSDGEPVNGTWTSIGTEIVSGGAASSDHDPMTVVGKTEYTWVPTTGEAPDEVPDLTAGTVRWFRVIAITYANDGRDHTGGTEVDIVLGGMIMTPSNEEDTPGDPADADPERGVTAGLGNAPADQDPEAPARPMDLTTEAASDSNDLADDDRGIFLTWNQVVRTESSTESETAYYVVERKRSDTGVDVLNDSDWVEIARVEDATSYTDNDRLREPTETRVYQVGSVASGIDDATYTLPEMGVPYALHPEMHEPLPVFSAPTMVDATSTGGTVTMTWMPGDLADSQIAIVVNVDDDTDYCVSPLLAGDASSYECPDRTVGESYVVLMIALDGQGGYMLGNVETQVAE